MKITDLKCAIIGNNPVVRITTDEGIDGIGCGEASKPYLKPHVLFYKDLILGADPRDVERVMRRIRRMGAFKPWGTAVSAIEVALWDIAGKASGQPIYRLLGGKVRDKVRVYNGNFRRKMGGPSPESHAENMKWMKELPQKFTIIKQGIAFHGGMASEVPNYYYGDYEDVDRFPKRGRMTEKGLKHTIACVEAMKEVLGDEVGLALDVGPGVIPQDALKLAQSLEHLNLMWMEDMITGDYTPHVTASLYRDVSINTSTPIHTGEQIYLRQNFMELIETRAVDVIGPDPLDVGGIAELKWIAEYADLHGIDMAPHGTLDGLIGLAALTHVSATLPQNYLAFELPNAQFPWWHDIVEGMPAPDDIVKDGFIDMADWERPGLGITLNDETRKYLKEEDADFLD